MRLFEITLIIILFAFLLNCAVHKAVTEAIRKESQIILSDQPAILPINV